MSVPDDFIWTPPGSDISQRWKRTGWVPPSQQPEYRQKWQYYRSLPGRRLEDEDVRKLYER